MNEPTCTVCDGKILVGDARGNVKYQGLQNFIAKSKKREDDKWKIWENVTQDQHTVFHEKCRKRYLALTDKPLSSRKKQKVTDPPIPVQHEQFQFDTLCILCEKSLDLKHEPVYKLDCKNNQESLLNWTKSLSVERGQRIANHIKYLLVAENVSGWYHVKCRQPPRVTKLRDGELEADMVFNEIADYIENSGNYKFELTQLRDIMSQSQFSLSLSNYRLFSKLDDKYGDDIVTIQQSGKQPVFFYKTKKLFENANEWLANPQLLSDFDKKILLNISTDIIKNEVKEQEYETTKYPPGKRFLTTVVSDIPTALKTFLDSLLTEKAGDTTSDQKFVRRDSIAHAIISILRPKSFISTLQLAVGTYILRKTGSKLIINLLSKLGMSASYHNLQMYEASTIVNPPRMQKEDSFVQFVFDNTDHNVNTLHGHETFHCLGGIAIYTPHHSVNYEGGSEKCSKMPSAHELASIETVPIVPFTSFDAKKMESIEFVDTDDLNFEYDKRLLTPTYTTYLLAKANEIPGVPSWKGFMERVSKDQTYSMSHIECLPFVNGSPSELTTLHSALLYAVGKNNECNQNTIFVTFDLPLYLKSRAIVQQSHNPDFERIVVRLGGFHLLLSYLGAMGHIMEESGLEDLWATVYAGESVKKLLSGHAFSRAVRAHILTFTAIAIIIIKRINGVSEAMKTYVNNFIETTEESLSSGDCESDILFKASTEQFLKELENLENKSGTPKLWVQYMKMVIIMLKFIESERLGNWTLNLQSMYQMQPILHAAGHFAYAKGLQIFLQDMANLEAKMNEEEYRRYTGEGFFTIRRSDKAFAGIWSDMTIEQTLNRFFGTDLKHGRGVTASVVARYLLGMPSAFQVMESLEEYSDLITANSEQHVDATDSRMRDDDRDITKFLFWLEEHEPFKNRNGLTSLSTGIVGDINTNCHMAFEKGREGMKSMIKKNITNVKLSTVTSKIRNFSTARKGIHINDEQHVVNTNLLFQRISVFFHGNESETRDALSYELAPYPPSLFDDEGFMRKTAKSELFKVFQQHEHYSIQLTDFCNVVDGGWLLHRVSWSHSKTFKQVFQMYHNYIDKKMGSDTKTVFDGYSRESINSTKSYERYRRKEKTVAPDIDIQIDSLITITQKKFLSNVANKYRFTELLTDYLNHYGIETTIARDDADVEIIEKALDMNEKTQKSVAVIGSDIDLLILLIACAPDRSNLYFYKIPPNQKNIQLYSTSSNKTFKPFILFAHAFAGCDSTNALYNQGKKNIITLLRKNDNLQNSVSIFYEKNKTIDELYPVAVNIIKRLYSASSDNLTITQLRYKIYNSLVITGKKESILASLPPTDSALRSHTRRVYYQMQIWLNNVEINPKDWGWKSTNFMLTPVMLEDGVPPAPEALLRNVFCTCLGDCSTSRCGCKKTGLRCSHLCKHCNGQSCSNRSQRRIEINEDQVHDETENVAEN